MVESKFQKERNKLREEIVRTYRIPKLIKGVKMEYFEMMTEVDELNQKIANMTEEEKLKTFLGMKKSKER